MTDLNLANMRSSPLSYTITDASSYLSEYHPSNIILDDPSNIHSRWAPAFSSASPHTQKHYLLLRLASPAILTSLRFGKYHKPHTTTLKDFKIYAGPSRSPASMTRILKDACRDDAKPQDFPCRHTDDDGIPFVVRYIRIEPLSSHGVHYNFSIWHIALSGISDPAIVNRVQQEYEMHRDTKSTRLILKHLRSRAHQTAFKALLASSPLLSLAAQQQQATNKIKRQPISNHSILHPRPFEHPLLSRLFKALTRLHAWEDVESILELAAFGKSKSHLHLHAEEHHSAHAAGKQRAVDHASRHTSSQQEQAEEQGEVLFSHFVSRTVPRSVWTPMPLVKRPYSSHHNNSSSYYGVSHQPPSRPGPRAGHQMVLDSTKSVVYLFGGWDGIRDLADFWAYDIASATWRCISMDTSQPIPAALGHPEGEDWATTRMPYGLGGAGPSARSCHRMVFDPRTGCIYLFGRFVEFPAVMPPNASSSSASRNNPASTTPTPATRSGNSNANATMTTPTTTAASATTNLVFQDVMIPSTNLLLRTTTSNLTPPSLAPRAGTATPGTSTGSSSTGSNSLGRPASIASLQTSAALSATAQALAAASNSHSQSAVSSPVAGGGAGGSGPVRLSAASTSTSHRASPYQPSGGTSLLNPSSSARNLMEVAAASSAGSGGSRTARSGGAGGSIEPTGLRSGFVHQHPAHFVHQSLQQQQQQQQQQQHASPAQRNAAVGESLASPAQPRATYSAPTGYESDFWRFSTRTQTWTRLSADTSVDDGTSLSSASHAHHSHHHHHHHQHGAGPNPGPKLVKDHTLCIDSEEQALYLFGGRIVHPNPSVVEYGGMWRYDIIRRVWSLLFDDEAANPPPVSVPGGTSQYRGIPRPIIPGREGHSMLFDPNITQASSSTHASPSSAAALSAAAAAAGGVTGAAAALHASRSGPGALLWVIGGKRDTYLSDMMTYNVRTGQITQVTPNFQIPFGPQPSFTPQITMDSRPEKREIYFLSALGSGAGAVPNAAAAASGGGTSSSGGSGSAAAGLEVPPSTSAGGGGGAGHAGDCAKMEMWVYSMDRKVWTSVLEPEQASTNAVLAATAAVAAAAAAAAAAAVSSSSSGSADHAAAAAAAAVARQNVRIGQAGAGLVDMELDEYGLRGGTSLTGSPTPSAFPGSAALGIMAPFTPGGASAAAAAAAAGMMGPKRQRRRDTLESEYEADEEARATLMLSSPPPSGPFHALPFPSTSVRRDEAMMMLMETDTDEYGHVGAAAAGGGLGGDHASAAYGGVGSSIRTGDGSGGGGGGANAADLARSAELYAGLEPRPRWASQMVYDPVREAFYLFGGHPHGSDHVAITPTTAAAAAAAQVSSSHAASSHAGGGGEGRAPTRLDDWWRLVLVRPSVEEVLRRTKFLVRKQRFLEMAAGSWAQQQQHQQRQQRSTFPDMAASEFGGGGGFAGPRAVEALLYLQTQVSAVVDHSDEAESQEFRRLMSKLLSGGMNSGSSVGAHAGASSASAAMMGLSSGFETSMVSYAHLEQPKSEAHRRKMRKTGRPGGPLTESRGGGRRQQQQQQQQQQQPQQRQRQRSHSGSLVGGAAALAAGWGIEGGVGGGGEISSSQALQASASMDVDTEMLSASVSNLRDHHHGRHGSRTTYQAFTHAGSDHRASDDGHGDGPGYGAAADEESCDDDGEEDENDDEDEDEDEEGEGGFEGGWPGRLSSDEAGERELLVNGREGQPSELWAQRVRLYRTLMDYFPPDCVEPRADLVHLLQE